MNQVASPRADTAAGSSVASVRTTRITPSAPMPERRSQSRATCPTVSSCLPLASGSSTKSFWVPWPLRKEYSITSGILSRGRGVQLLGVRRAVVLVELGDRALGTFELLGQHRSPRHDGLGIPRVGLPQLRSHERLGAVVEDRLALDPQRHPGPVALALQRVEEVRLGDEPGAAVDPQRVAATGDHEEQADVRVLQDVAVAVGPSVAG